MGLIQNFRSMFIKKVDEPKTPDLFQRNFFEFLKNQQLNSDWSVIPDSVGDGNFKYDVPTLRAKARDLEINNAYASAFFENMEKNVIGKSGFNLQLRVQNADQTPDTYANMLIENRFFQWSKNCTIDGQTSWVELQNIILRSMLRDGEIFIHLVSTSNNAYGLQLQVIEADYVDYQKNDTLTNGNYIRHGIEYNSYHAPTAVYISQFPSDANREHLNAPTNYVRIPMENMLHIYKKNRVSQGRGYSWMSAAIHRLRMLNSIDEASLTNIRVAASKMGFLSKANGTLAEYTGTQKDFNGNFVNSVEPGEIEILPEGYSFESFNPAFPDASVDSFIKHMLRSIATALGVSYGSLTMDMSDFSYSSGRIGVDLERDSYRKLQTLLMEKFFNKVFEKWLINALASNALAPLPFQKLSKFQNYEWIPKAFEYVNPIDDINADINAMANNMTTLTDVLAKKGVDLEDHFSKLANEKKLKKKYGL